MNQFRLSFIMDCLDWDKVTEEECGVLLVAQDDERIEKIYREKKDKSYDRFLFQSRRKRERERWEKAKWMDGALR